MFEVVKIMDKTEYEKLIKELKALSDYDVKFMFDGKVLTVCSKEYEFEDAYDFEAHMKEPERAIKRVYDQYSGGMWIDLKLCSKSAAVILAVVDRLQHKYDCKGMKVDCYSIIGYLKNHEHVKCVYVVPDWMPSYEQE